MKNKVTDLSPLREFWWNNWAHVILTAEADSLSTDANQLLSNKGNYMYSTGHVRLLWESNEEEEGSHATIFEGEVWQKGGRIIHWFARADRWYAFQWYGDCCISRWRQWPQHSWGQFRVNGKVHSRHWSLATRDQMLHLENARKLRGIYFIDPEDTEFIETIKNARKKLETSVTLAMPCKIMKNCGSGGSDKNKTKLACIWWIHKTAHWRIFTKSSWRPYWRKRRQFTAALQSGSQIFPMPQAMKISAAKAAVDKEWEKLKKISAWNLTKVRSKKEVIDEARTKGAKVPFASIMDICHLKNAELEAKHQKYIQVEFYSEAILWEMIQGLMQCPLNWGHQHHKWQQQKSWISSSHCQVAQDKQLTQYLLVPR